MIVLSVALSAAELEHGELVGHNNAFAMAVAKSPFNRE